MQDMLYDQLTQHTKKELAADLQMGGPEQKYGVFAEGDGARQEEDGRERTLGPKSGDSTRNRRIHGPTGRTIPKLEKRHCVLEKHRRL